MKKFLIFILILIFGAGCSPRRAYTKWDKACVNDKCFNIEVVYKDKDRQKGLQFRKSLDKDAGMLFAFDKSSIYTFWMKDTLIPLDIIWIDYAHKIVFMEKNVKPCEEIQCEYYIPDQEAMYVLELNGGTADELGFKVGDSVEFKENKK